MEYFPWPFNVYVYGFAYVNKLANQSVVLSDIHINVQKPQFIL